MVICTIISPLLLFTWIQPQLWLLKLRFLGQFSASGSCLSSFHPTASSSVEVHKAMQKCTSCFFQNVVLGRADHLEVLVQTWVLWCSSVNLEVKFREMSKGVFLETSTLGGKKKWIKRKESIVWIGKLSTFQKQMGIVVGFLNIILVNFYEKKYFPVFLFLFLFFVPEMVFEFCQLSRVWIMVEQVGGVLLKLVLINIWGSVNYSVSL